MADSIYIKSAKEIESMRVAGKITAGARSIARQAIHDGVTTREIDREVRSFIRKSGATPTFYQYGGFPGNLCEGESGSGSDAPYTVQFADHKT